MCHEVFYLKIVHAILCDSFNQITAKKAKQTDATRQGREVDGITKVIVKLTEEKNHSLLYNVDVSNRKKP